MSKPKNDFETFARGIADEASREIAALGGSGSGERDTITALWTLPATVTKIQIPIDCWLTRCFGVTTSASWFGPTPAVLPAGLHLGDVTMMFGVPPSGVSTWEGRVKIHAGTEFNYQTNTVVNTHLIMTLEIPHPFEAF